MPGTPLVTAEIRAHRALLVLLTSDAAPNAIKRITDSCNTHHVELIRIPYTKAQIASAIGQSGEVATVALLDSNFKKAILSILNADMTEADKKNPQEV